MPRKATTIVTALAAVLGVSGCYSPKGGMMPSSSGAQTYYSYETRPVTVTILDLRTAEQIFTMNVPPGKQLTFNFKGGEGDDPVYNPDLMIYEVFKLGTQTGKLQNSLSVPPANARRIDVTYRNEYEYRAAMDTGQIDYDQIVNLPHTERPEDIWGTSERVTNVDPDKNN